MAGQESTPQTKTRSKTDPQIALAGSLVYGLVASYFLLLHGDWLAVVVIGLVVFGGYRFTAALSRRLNGNQQAVPARYHPAILGLAVALFGVLSLSGLNYRTESQAQDQLRSRAGLNRCQITVFGNGRIYDPCNLWNYQAKIDRAQANRQLTAGAAIISLAGIGLLWVLPLAEKPPGQGNTPKAKTANDPTAS